MRKRKSVWKKKKTFAMNFQRKANVDVANLSLVLREPTQPLSSSIPKHAKNTKPCGKGKFSFKRKEKIG